MGRSCWKEFIEQRNTEKSTPFIMDYSMYMRKLPPGQGKNQPKGL